MKKRKAGRPADPIEAYRLMKPVQSFSDGYLEKCKRMKPAEILRFLDNFRLLYAPERRKANRQISLKVSEELLETFKTKARLDGVPYQTQIKRLMTEWVTGHSMGTDARKDGTARDWRGVSTKV